MMVPAYIRRAAKIIDRYFLAPRRRRTFMRALGVDDLTTKFDVARRQHRPTKALQEQVTAACRAQLEREVRHG